MEPRITLLTLCVSDLDRSVRFYRDGLGWPLSSASQDDVAFFRSGGTVLALWSRQALADDAGIAPEGSGFGGVSLAHNVRERTEVDVVLAEALAAGATLLRPAAEVFWGGYTAYFADPDGYPWEVAWNPFFPFNADGSLNLPE